MMKIKRNDLGEVETVVNFQSFNQNAQLNLRCLDVAITNRGTVNAYINDRLLLPSSANYTGETYVIGANQGEVITGNYQLRFEAGSAVADCLVYVEWRYYK